MKLALVIALLAPLLRQDPASVPAPIPPQNPPQNPPQAGVLLVPSGDVQAPTQPSGKSSATYTRGERTTPQPGRGTSKPLRATVETLVQVRGQEDNAISGIGLVTGLAGTGDSVNIVRQLVSNLLLARNIRIDPQQISPKNVAVVQIEGTLPAGVQPGQKIDVRVSTLGDAKSLQGGTLVFTELADANGVVYATAAGPVDVGGFKVEGNAASVSRNTVTVGLIAGGGKIERAVVSDIVTERGLIYLDARSAHDSFANLVRITAAINAVYPGAAEAATDARTVKIRVPGDLPKSAHVAYLDSILHMEIEPQSAPCVVVNERTGTIVMGEGVRLRPGAVAFGNLTVTIGETPEVSQPGPLSNGVTQKVDRTDLNVHEDNNALVEVRGAVTLQEVVEVLNVLGTTPRELISILESMNQSGLLLAEVQRL
jgi:flagellar P-ring protein precursor FlgI